MLCTLQKISHLSTNKFYVLDTNSYVNLALSTKYYIQIITYEFYI